MVSVSKEYLLGKLEDWVSEQQVLAPALLFVKHLPISESYESSLSQTMSHYVDPIREALK